MKKMNDWIAVLCIVTVFAACQSNKATQNVQEDQKVGKPEMPGSDKDDHGCIGSAGYTWSELKKDCIRPFEVGMKLNGIVDTNKNFAVYVVFSPDSAQAEIFVPHVEGGVLLSRIGEEWKNDIFSLKRITGKWSLEDKGEEIFAN